MPEMEIPEPKTPVYDVVVWLHGESTPITVAWKKVKNEAIKIAGNVGGQLASKWWYKTTEDGDEVGFLNKHYIVKCELVACTHQKRSEYADLFEDNDTLRAYYLHNRDYYMETVPLYLEDLETEND